MRVTILTVGSRGDVQPYAAIARRLLDAGHDVKLATHERFRWLVDALSVPIHAMQREAILTYHRLFANGRLMRAPRASWREARSTFWAAMDEWDQAVAGADVLLAHPSIFVAPELARRHGAAVAFADTLPVSCPTSEYPCCYVMARSRGSLLNRLSYAALPAALTPLKRWAASWLAAKGVRDLPRGRWDLRHRDGTPIPHLHGHSEVALPRPRDWPEAWSVTGYWHARPPDGWAPDPALASFLEAGPPPIYVGFGSMVYHGNRRSLTRDIVRGLVDRGERALLVRGWALSDEDVRDDDRVHFVDAYEGPWHAWLFERVKAVVHHGGPGTFGAALAAGVRQVCCPFGMDQPFWAHRAAGLGVAPAPLSMRSWSADAWVGRVEAILGNTSFADQARRMADEDGTGAVLRAVEKISQGRLPSGAESK